MPLIGIYRGRDRSDNKFKSDYQLTLLPFGPNAGGAIPIFSPSVSVTLPFSGATLQTDSFTTLNAAVTLPFSGATLQTDSFTTLNAAVTLPFSGATLQMDSFTTLNAAVNLPFTPIGGT